MELKRERERERESLDFWALSSLFFSKFPSITDRVDSDIDDMKLFTYFYSKVDGSTFLLRIYSISWMLLFAFLVSSRGFTR